MNCKISTYPKIIFFIAGGFGSVAALPMIFAAKTGGKYIPGLNLIPGSETISLCCSVLANVLLNTHEVYSRITPSDHGNESDPPMRWYHYGIAMLGAMPKVTIGYNDLPQNGWNIFICACALAVHTAINIRGAKMLKAFFSKEKKESGTALKTEGEIVAGVFLFVIAFVGLFSYCAISGRTLLFSSTDNPWAILGAAFLPSIVFLLTIADGCMQVGKLLISNIQCASNKKCAFQCRNIALLFFISGIAYGSVGAGLAANRVFLFPSYAAVIQDIATILTISLFNTIGLHALKEYFSGEAVSCCGATSERDEALLRAQPQNGMA